MSAFSRAVEGQHAEMMARIRALAVQRIEEHLARRDSLPAPERMEQDAILLSIGEKTILLHTEKYEHEGKMIDCKGAMRRLMEACRQ